MLLLPRTLTRAFSTALLLAAIPLLAPAQTATIAETTMVFPTYPFSDPDPVARMGNIYPYFRFQGYSMTPVDRAWKIIVMENSWVRVLVAPEIGGKILGAQEKSTGRWFIYFNRVVKFREIAMRGPWTSGGIEFNFGDIGHAPTTSNPVDYLARTNTDGSVSCIVGALDLPSRTEWRVEIRLPGDRALFETRSFWFNPTESAASFYHWMNAAANADSTLQMLYPGTGFIGHAGEASRWPVNNAGRDLSYYRNNDFGSYKSYHVLGSYTDFFGARWGNAGVIHYAPYTDKPGKKLWIWGLSREGEIWVDLLTDPRRGNTQYVELQSGIHFNQAMGLSSLTPFKHMQFLPNSSVRFTESWFPFTGLEGVVRATPEGALNVWKSGGRLHYAFCPTGTFNDSIALSLDGAPPLTRRVSLRPLQTYRDSVAASGAPFTIAVGSTMRYASNDESDLTLDRPVTGETPVDWSSAYGHATMGRELFRQRDYEGALAEYRLALAKDPAYLPALSGAAGLYLRRMEADSAFLLARRALEIDTYDPESNYMFGLAERRRNRRSDAVGAFGIAARSRDYAPAANLQIAEIRFLEGDRSSARVYAERTLEDDHGNIGALRLLALLSRGDAPRTEERLTAILALDPLNHFARFERSRLKGTSLKDFAAGIRNELPQETCLELAAWYSRMGCNEDALAVLSCARDHPLVLLWQGFLAAKLGRTNDAQRFLNSALAMPTTLAFPHRQEDARVLLWADAARPHWKTKYYLALLSWSLGRRTDAAAWFDRCGNDPGEASFYMSRASFPTGDPDRARKEYLRALKTGPGEWRTSYNAVNFLNEQGWYAEALSISRDAVQRFPSRYVLQFQFARTLLFNNDVAAGKAVLDTLAILPFEGARYGRDAYREATLLSATASMSANENDRALWLIEQGRLWPERLGAGKPYDVDTRIEDYLEATVRREKNDSSGCRRLLEYVAQYSLRTPPPAGIGVLCGAFALRDLGMGSRGDSLLAAWSAREPADPRAAWALAVYRRDTQGKARVASPLFNRATGDQELVLMVNIVRALSW
jgi:tetratricopeptide (TPR) repeat protein